jgi:iron complex outermembrane receptor protein
LIWNRSQKGVPGLGLVDGLVPTGIPSDIQLSRYSWVLPTQIKSINSGLKVDHELDTNNRVFFNLSRSDAHINDRLAYPIFTGSNIFQVWDFRSENELRRTDQIQIGLSTKFNLGNIENHLKYGIAVMQRNLYQGHARFDQVGTDNLYSLTTLNPEGTDIVGPRLKTLTHKQNSFFIQDNAKINSQVDIFLNTRFIQLSDKSYSAGTYSNNAGTSLGDLKKNYLIPSIGATYQITPQVTTYISYSEGVEPGTKPIETSFVDASPLKPRSIYVTKILC